MTKEERRIPAGLRSASSGEDHAPPDWDSSPTNRSRRIALTVIAAGGFGIALYLTLCQVGVLGGVWDPWFDSYKVLSFTEPFPVAVLGLLAYGTEMVLSFIGGPTRWRTMPWVTLAFGFVAITGAGVSIFLMIIQPTWVGSWCTLCLASAAISLALCGWGTEEALASLQHLKKVRESGGSLWRAFWGTGGEQAPIGVSAAFSVEEPSGVIWKRLVSTALGIGPRLVGVVFGVWLMMAPAVVGYSDPVAIGNDHVMGPFIVGASFLALWPSLRILRWAVLPMGFWVMFAPFFIDYEHVHYAYNLLPEILDVCIGLILMVLSFVDGPVRRSFGGGWASVMPFVVREMLKVLREPLP